MRESGEFITETNRVNASIFRVKCGTIELRFVLLIQNFIVRSLDFSVDVVLTSGDDLKQIILYHYRHHSTMHEMNAASLPDTPE
jgi:hypothetical protein